MTSEPGSARRTGAHVAALGVLVCSWLCSTVLVSPAAFALHREDGDDPGPQMSTSEAFLVFGVIPIAVSAVITLLVWMPSLVRKRPPGR